MVGHSNHTFIGHEHMGNRHRTTHLRAGPDRLCPPFDILARRCRLICHASLTVELEVCTLYRHLHTHTRTRTQTHAHAHTHTNTRTHTKTPMGRSTSEKKHSQCMTWHGTTCMGAEAHECHRLKTETRGCTRQHAQAGDRDEEGTHGGHTCIRASGLIFIPLTICVEPKS